MSNLRKRTFHPGEDATALGRFHWYLGSETKSGSTYGGTFTHFPNSTRSTNSNSNCLMTFELKPNLI